MKGVIDSIAPEARVVDLSHAVPPQDVRSGAFVLATGYEVFPEGTVHVAVVDPGVGSARRAIALAAGGYRWVAPDNGLLGYALAALAACGQLGGRWDDGWWLLGDDAQAVELTESRYWRPTVSQTFHGRDIFSPVAAHLACGVPLDALGPRIDRVQALAMPRPARTEHGWRGEVIYVDRFGNLITNLSMSELGGTNLAWDIVVAGPQRRPRGKKRRPMGDLPDWTAVINGLRSSYAEISNLGALIGSAGFLEIAEPNGSAAKLLAVEIGRIVDAYPRGTTWD
jgi:hypothetical protein